MKNKKDLSLYKQTLKQLLLPAIIMGVICIVASVINMSVSNDINSRYEFARIFRVIIFKFYGGQPIAAAIAPALIIFMYVGSAVFTYLAFKHQNSRSASDFYGSMPHSSLNNYLSRIAAVLTWQVGIIVLSMCASVIAMMGGHITFDASFIPRLTLSFIAGSLLIIGGVAIAMSITGHFASNIIAAFVILAVPRFMLFVFDRLILGATWDIFTDISKMGIFLNPVYNIPTAVILDLTSMWQYYGTSETLINVGAIIYTSVLGILYLGVALWLMRRRKSELAGRGTSGKALAHILSAAVSLPLLAYAFFSLSAHGVFVFSSQPKVQKCVIFLLVGLLTFIISEFIMRRSVKASLKSLPVFLLTFVAALGLIYAQKEIGVKISSKVPDANQIEYIKIDENHDAIHRYKPLYSYKKLMTKDVEFDDPELIVMLQQTLARNVDELNKRRNDGNLYFTREGEAYVEFKLKNGRSIYRNMDFYPETIEDIRMLVGDNCDYKRLTYTLPPMEDVQNISIYGQDRTYNGFGYDIYSSYLNEFEELDFGGKSDVVYHNDYGNLFNISGNNIYSFYPEKIILQSFSVSGNMKGYKWLSGYNISNLFPETSKLYLKEINSISGQDFLEDLENLETDATSFSNLNVDIELISSKDLSTPDFQRYVMRYSEGIDHDNYLSFSELKEILGPIGADNLRNVSFDTPMININFSYTDNDLRNYTGYNMYLKVTQEQFDELYMIFIDKLDN